MNNELNGSKLKFNWKLIKSELKVNYKLSKWLNIQMNELHGISIRDKYCVLKTHLRHRFIKRCEIRATFVH